MEITNASTWFLLLFSITVHQCFAARTLHPPQPPANLAITFSMPDVLGGNNHRTAARKPLNGHNNRLPFSKPQGYYNPPTTNDPGPMSAVLPSQLTLDLDGISMSFPAVATLQEMELGAVTTIDEDIYGGGDTAASLIGKAQGVYVAASSDGGNGTRDHMMAMTASFFGSGYRDRLKFFGVHREDAGESHVAVIGGSGRYRNANGFATVRTVSVSATSKEVYRLLVFDVNLG